MSDDSVKIMQSLGLDYNSAIKSTQLFAEAIQKVDNDLANMKLNALKAAKDVNTAWAAELGHLKHSGWGMAANEIVRQNKTIFDQYGNSLRTFQNDIAKSATTAKEAIKQSTLAGMEAEAVSLRQKAPAKGLSEEYSLQATIIRNQITALQQKLASEGRLSAEEIKQTAQLKEQLAILKSQTQIGIAGQSAPNIAAQGFQRRAEWFLTGSLVFGATSALRETVQTISEVEMGVTEIARVMEDSAFVFRDYRDELLQLGIDYGQTFDAVQDIALRWAQAGYNVRDSIENTKTSLLALNTAELDAAKATEGLIGIMSQWQLTANDLPLVLDKINKTAWAA